jgi:hypothetical protein
VTLSESEKNIFCPLAFVNLNDLLTGAVPAGASLVWYDNAQHTGMQIADPTSVPAGVYYAFFFDAANNCLNTNNSTAKVTVSPPPLVNLSKTTTGAICPATTVNLNSLVMGNLPAGAEVRWFTNDLHSGPYLSDPTQVSPGVYYAFYFMTGCYTTDKSVAKIIVVPTDCATCNAGVTPVQLTSIALAGPVSNTCPNATVNLNDYVVGNPPVGAEVKWFTAISHAPGTEVVDPSQVGAGKYYPFFYDAVNDCYNTQVIYVDVVIDDCGTCNAGTEQVLLLTYDDKTFCPNAIWDLNFYVNSVNQPAGTSIGWYTDPMHTVGNEVANPSAVGVGTYYAFFFDAANQCFNTNNSTAIIKTGVYNNNPALSTNSLSNTCPQETVDLGSTLLGEGAVEQAVWFDNPNHSGQKIADPMNAGQGTYYAFFYDEGKDCYNTDNSTALVTVTITSCAPTVQLGLKVALQGAMADSGSEMRNNLQNNEFLGCLLPTIDPYNGSAQYLDIANENGIAGKVVDWVKVDLYDIQTLAPLESKSLLLKTDGFVVDVDGNAPGFNLHPNGVFIIVKHRNHVPIMSLATNFNTPQVTYDFRVDISRAYNEAQGPNIPKATPQMTLVNGVWCMNAGDGYSDFGVDNVDAFTYNDSFDKGEFGYLPADFNLDGSVDNVDSFFFNTNFDAGSYSILLNLQLF